MVFLLFYDVKYTHSGKMCKLQFSMQPFRKSQCHIGLH